VVTHSARASTEASTWRSSVLARSGIGSLGEYLVVSHREQRVYQHRRLATGQWLLTELAGDAVIEIAELGGSIAVASLYAKVRLDEGRSG